MSKAKDLRVLKELGGLEPRRISALEDVQGF